MKNGDVAIIDQETWLPLSMLQKKNKKNNENAAITCLKFDPSG